MCDSDVIHTHTDQSTVKQFVVVYFFVFIVFIKYCEI